MQSITCLFSTIILAMSWTIHLLELNFFGALSDDFKMMIEPNPMIAIFGLAGENNDSLTGMKLKVTKCVTLLAWRLILLHLWAGLSGWGRCCKILSQRNWDSQYMAPLNHLSSTLELSFNPRNLLNVSPIVRFIFYIYLYLFYGTSQWNMLFFIVQLAVTCSIF